MYIFVDDLIINYVQLLKPYWKATYAYSFHIYYTPSIKYQLRINVILGPTHKIGLKMIVNFFNIFHLHEQTNLCGIITRLQNKRSQMTPTLLTQLSLWMSNTSKVFNRYKNSSF